MKLIVIFLASVLTISATAQEKWYYKKYQVNDLSELNPEQYKQANQDAKYLAWGSLIVTGIGVGGYFVGKSTVKKGLDEDATFLEELLGKNFVGYGTMGIGIIAVTGGIIGSITGVTRLGMIKKSGREAMAPYGYMNIFPQIIICRQNSPTSMGIALQINF